MWCKSKRHCIASSFHVAKQLHLTLLSFKVVSVYTLVMVFRYNVKISSYIGPASTVQTCRTVDPHPVGSLKNIDIVMRGDCDPAVPPSITPLTTGNSVPTATPFPLPYAFFPLAGVLLTLRYTNSCRQYWQDWPCVLCDHIRWQVLSSVRVLCIEDG